jgi:two-component system LytT family response regulator
MLKAIIVDDELSCIETLQLMLEKKFSSLVQVVATSSVPKETITIIEQTDFDILFLDVEMPGITGIQLLQSVQDTNFHVIFTTAHQHYAIQAIKLNALDYLTKPISLSELSTALDKCNARPLKDGNNLIQNFIQQIAGSANKKIPISTGTNVQLVPVVDIIRVESQSNYSIFYFTNQPKQTVTKTLKEIEEQLAPYNFLRIHHSHLINLDKVIGYKNQDSGYVIMQGNEIIEISRRKKQEVIQRLNTL